MFASFNMVRVYVKSKFTVNSTIGYYLLVLIAVPDLSSRLSFVECASTMPCKPRIRATKLASNRWNQHMKPPARNDTTTNRVCLPWNQLANLVKFMQSTPYKFCDLWHYGVSESFKSVHPMGYPITTSPNEGFR